MYKVQLRVCSFLPLGGWSKQGCGARREFVAGRPSVQDFQCNGNVKYAVFLTESAARTEERTSRPTNRKVHGDWMLVLAAG